MSARRALLLLAVVLQTLSGCRTAAELAARPPDATRAYPCAAASQPCDVALQRAARLVRTIPGVFFSRRELEVGDTGEVVALHTDGFTSQVAWSLTARRLDPTTAVVELRSVYGSAFGDPDDDHEAWSVAEAAFGPSLP